MKEKKKRRKWMGDHGCSCCGSEMSLSCMEEFEK
jgi:hypothetical protein